MERVPETEVMDNGEQVLAYARTDFATSNQWYVNHLVACLSDRLSSVLDLGCGPGDIDILLAQAHQTAHITALDASAPMFSEAHRRVVRAGLERRITLVQGYLPGVRLDEHSFGTMVSKDMLHHLPEPTVLWREAVRLGQPGATVCVMDLVRPPTTEAAREIVESVAASESPVLNADFFNSLCAAFTPEEVYLQAESAGLQVQIVPAGDRHMLITGTLP